MGKFSWLFAVASGKKASEIVDEINNTVNQWKRFADDVNVKPTLRAEIAKTLLDLNK